jgi:hypothetical protein
MEDEQKQGIYWRWDGDPDLMYYGALYFMDDGEWHRVYRSCDCYGHYKIPREIALWLEETQPIPAGNDGYYALHVPSVLAFRYFSMKYDAYKRSQA